VIIYDDDTFYVESGEALPFICPECGKTIPFDVNLEEVTCPRCGLKGSSEDFTCDDFEFKEVQ
jgi:hypothetical protein